MYKQMLHYICWFHSAFTLHYKFLMWSG